MSVASGHILGDELVDGPQVGIHLFRMLEVVGDRRVDIHPPERILLAGDLLCWLAGEILPQDGLDGHTMALNTDMVGFDKLEVGFQVHDMIPLPATDATRSVARSR